MYAPLHLTRPVRRRRPGLGRVPLFTLFVAVWVVAAAVSNAQTSTQQTSSTAPISSAPQEVFGKYCISCHNQRLKTAGLALDTLDATNPSAAPEVWERVIGKLR